MAIDGQGPPNLEFRDRRSFDASAGLAKAMKRYPYCGKQYADDADIGPVDQQTPVNLAGRPRRIGAPGPQDGVAFNAKLVSHGVAVGTYRIYLRGQDLVFVQVDKEKINQGVDFVAGLLGPAGALVAVAAGLWQKHKVATAPAHDDDGGPEDSPYPDENSFSIHVPEIRDAALEPPGRLTLSEKQAGRRAEEKEVVPKDAWGQEFICECPGKRSPESYDLLSMGLDGLEGAEDDIASWQPDNQLRALQTGRPAA